MKFSLSLIVTISVCILKSGFLISSVHDLSFPEIKKTLIFDDKTHSKITSIINNESLDNVAYPSLSHKDWRKFKSNTEYSPTSFSDSNNIDFYRIGFLRRNNITSYVVLEKVIFQDVITWTYHLIRYKNMERTFFFNDFIGYFEKYSWENVVGNTVGILLFNGDYVSYNSKFNEFFYAFNDSSNKWHPDKLNFEEIFLPESMKSVEYNFLHLWQNEDKRSFTFDIDFYHKNKNYLPLALFFNSFDLNSKIVDEFRSDDVDLDMIYLLEVRNLDSTKSELLILVERYNECSCITNSSVYLVELSDSETYNISELSYLKPRVVKEKVTEYNIYQYGSYD